MQGEVIPFATLCSQGQVEVLAVKFVMLGA